MWNHATFDIAFALLALLYPLLRHQLTSNLLAVGLKCLPMSFLIGVLFLQQRAKPVSYGRNILLGLIFSTIGDAFLVYTDTCSHSLLGGVGAFGVAHIFYISAFGLRPFKLSGAAIVVAIQAIAFVILREQLMQMGKIYLVVVPIYMGLLLAMAWRASVASTSSAFKGSNNSCSCLIKLGGLSFVASDAVLALTEITGMISTKLVPPQASTILILSTYYLAQYCFARSALQDSAKTAKQIKQKPKPRPSKDSKLIGRKQKSR